MARLYEGDQLDEWILHFCLPYNLEEFLESDEIGVTTLSDLEMIITDAELLAKVRQHLMPNEQWYKKFCAAVRATKILSTASFDLLVEDDQSHPITNTDCTSSIVEENTETRSILQNIEKTKDEIIRHKEYHTAKAQAKLNRLRTAAIEVVNSCASIESDVKAAERDLARARRLADIRKAQKIFASSANGDICVGMDCTGSMEPFIEQMATKAISFIDSIKELHPDLQLRVAFIAYRDIDDGVGRIDVLPFTSDIERFKHKVSVQKAYGGGDACEDVFGFLNAASQLDWQSTARILLHIADYPCHGSKYHFDLVDDYPTGDPDGLTDTILLPKLHGLNVQYVFCKITKHTDQMIAVFNETMGCEFVKTIETPDATMLIDALTTEVTTTLTASLSSTLSVDTSRTDTHAFVMVTAEPQWESIDGQPALRFPLRPLVSFESIQQDPEKSCVVECAIILQAKTSVNPFAQGGCRVAHKALEKAELKSTTSAEDLPSPMIDRVHKLTKKLRSKHRTKEAYEESLKPHFMASCLAAEFNTAVNHASAVPTEEGYDPVSYPQITYVDAGLVQYVAKDGMPWCSSEEYIDGQYIKFNNNNGTVTRESGHDIVQAFSHWTFHRTNGDLLVCDCQGAFDEAKEIYRLTDPAIHCHSNAQRFGGTNLSTLGMIKFFKNHRCGQMCSLLGVASPSECLSELNSKL